MNKCKRDTAIQQPERVKYQWNVWINIFFQWNCCCIPTTWGHSTEIQRNKKRRNII